MKRVIAIFLDGYDHSLERRMAAAGELPALSALAARSARFALDHGAARRTGLAGEHVATGLAPERSARHCGVQFSPSTYDCTPLAGGLEPFVSRLSSRALVFDVPGLDLQAAPTVRGIAGWRRSASDAATTFRPAGLATAFTREIGAYPADEWIDGFAWASPQRCRAMGEALAAAVDLRSRAARWLLDRNPEWQFALIGVSEPRSAGEALWHGIDPAHPLHGLPSAQPAAAGLHAVYRAVDRLVGDLLADHPDAQVVVFAMHGMGSNHSDTATRLLLPELMYRHAFERPLFRQPAGWRDPESNLAWPVDHRRWETNVAAGFPWWEPKLWRSTLERRAPHWLRAVLAPVAMPQAGAPASDGTQTSTACTGMPLGWSPAMSYRPWWPEMTAFALPSHDDGRIRLNLVGRERHGKVLPQQYSSMQESIARMLHQCRDAATGEQVIDGVESTRIADPCGLGPTEADLNVGWRRAVQAIDHPRLGRIGPVPMRRTGAASAAPGFAYLCADGVAAGEHGKRSAFDVVPTLLALLGEQRAVRVSGRSLLAEEAVAA